jgi:hypothetical protein
MKQVHKQHLESGYFAEVNYQEITDKHGHADWLMFYKPSPDDFVNKQPRRSFGLSRNVAV